MKKIFDYKSEKERLFSIYTYETEYMKKGYKLIGGADEAGRGPLVGPVSAACVILKNDFYIPGLDDSKKIPEKYREELYDVIIGQSISYGIAMIDNTIIDEINILNATKKAMCGAIEKMQVKPDFLLLDYIDLKILDIPQLPLVKGDSKSASIAAASVLAKVTRDRYMRKIDEEYPQYGFMKNKGYGTKQHYEALAKYGPCPLHRKTFIKNLNFKEIPDMTNLNFAEKSYE